MANDEEEPMNFKRIALWGGIAVAIVVAGWWVSRPNPLQVVTATVERGAVEATVANTRAGTIEACRRANLSLAQGGQIANLPIRKGQIVETGELLAELWNEDLKAQLLLAERGLVAGEARAVETCTRADVARREASRTASLFKSGLASEENRDRTDGDARATAAACRAAHAARDVNSAQVDVAHAALDRTILRAPFTGVVAEINGELNEFVTPSPIGVATPPVVDLIAAGCIFVSAPIDEVDAPSIQVNQSVRVHIDAYPDQSFPGNVRRVAPYVLDLEKQARTVEVEVEVEYGPEVKLLPGYSADVEILLQRRDDVLRVPTEAVIEGPRVWVLDPVGTLSSRKVRTGLRNWRYTEILEGLSAGESVVTSVDRNGIDEGVSAESEEPS
ncbi:MAG: efflux RND transporter periplasmic adaptor subunit [Gammaproteobacteria bacterium]|jgi:HlyD family secretion protein|nr:efflux RND transporter periplasmic adaptor subunit [Gammaproteobacteria bacterium]